MIKELKTCEICGVQFKAHHNWNRFCGRACGVIGRSGPSRKNPTKLHCKQCGKEYLRSRMDAKKSKFCDIKCMADWKRTNQHGKANPNFRNAGWKKCVGCGKLFKHYSTARRFCGQSCVQSSYRSFALANAKAGLDAEKKAVKKLTAMGYTCTLSKGSRGAVDVIAVSALEVIFVQVKYSCLHWRRFMQKDIRKLNAFVCPQLPCIRKWLLCLVKDRGWFVLDNGKESTL